MLIMNLKTMFFRYSMFALSRDLQNIQKYIYDKDDDTAEVEEDNDDDDDDGGDEDNYRDLK